MLCRLLLVLFAGAGGGLAQGKAAAPVQLTIYSDNFAVVRTTLPLDLHAGSNDVVTTDVTSQLEPDSVVLRDAAGKHPLRVLEQNYDNGVATQQRLLQEYEGQTIEFQVRGPHEIETAAGESKLLPPVFVHAKVVRAGTQQSAYGQPPPPLIEYDGHLQFSMPGTPVFPVGTSGLLLKPTLRWVIASAAAERFSGELDYITTGLRWQATYNVVLPEAAATETEHAEVLGWVTMENHSGKNFPAASVQLMAGDVAKIWPVNQGGVMDAFTVSQSVQVTGANQVSQKAFDDFHLYDLHRTLSLANEEVKQVQFLSAADVSVNRSYEFEASEAAPRFYPNYFNGDPRFGNAYDAKVHLREEIQNSENNHLGMPLSAGRLRLYRQETSGQLQFVGEATVPHTPEGRPLHFVSGSSFDITGERKQTEFHFDNQARTATETLSVTLHNAKPQPVTVHDVEHLSRAENWEITAHSLAYTKTDSSTVDFPVQVPAHGDASVTYTVHYSW